MIGFDLTPDQRALQEKARRFSKEAATAKAFVVDVAKQVTTHAVQI